MVALVHSLRLPLNTAVEYGSWTFVCRTDGPFIVVVGTYKHAAGYESRFRVDRASLYAQEEQSLFVSDVSIDGHTCVVHDADALLLRAQMMKYPVVHRLTRS